MPSTNKTSNLKLSQFLGTDVPSWLGDYNSDMKKIDDAFGGLQGGASDDEIAQLQTEIDKLRHIVNNVSQDYEYFAPEHKNITLQGHLSSGSRIALDGTKNGLINHIYGSCICGATSEQASNTTDDDLYVLPIAISYDNLLGSSLGSIVTNNNVTVWGCVNMYDTDGSLVSGSELVSVWNGSTTSFYVKYANREAVVTNASFTFDITALNVA